MNMYNNLFLTCFQPVVSAISSCIFDRFFSTIFFKIAALITTIFPVSKCIDYFFLKWLHLLFVESNIANDHLFKTISHH